MKKNVVLPVLILIITNNMITAQNHSCDVAYRFDAAYTRELEQLEDVTIKLQVPGAPKNSAETGRKTGAINSFYACAGAASPKQFQSIDANIGFEICYVLQPNLELYKCEVANGMRTFAVPAGTGGNRAVNIPIQVITPPGSGNPNTGQVNWGRGYFKVKIINGYLPQGEYVLIDKNSISPEGKQMKGYAFAIM